MSTNEAMPEQAPDPQPVSQEQAAQPQPAQQQQQAPARPLAPTGPRPTRVGTIVWGAMVLVACAFVAQATLAPGTLDATAWVTALVLGLGVLLLVAGVAAVVKQARRR